MSSLELGRDATGALTAVTGGGAEIEASLETKGTSASSKHCINALAIAAVEVAGFQTMGQPAARPGAR